MNEQERENMIAVMEWFRQKPEQSSQRVQVKTVDLALVLERIDRIQNATLDVHKKCSRCLTKEIGKQA